MSTFIFTSGRSSIHHQHKDYGIKEGLEDYHSHLINALEDVCKSLLRYVETNHSQAQYFTVIAVLNHPKLKRKRQSRYWIFHYTLTYGTDHFNRPNQCLSVDFINQDLINLDELTQSSITFKSYWITQHTMESERITLDQIKSSKNLSSLGFISIQLSTTSALQKPKEHSIKINQFYVFIALLTLLASYTYWANLIGPASIPHDIPQVTHESTSYVKVLRGDLASSSQNNTSLTSLCKIDPLQLKEWIDTLGYNHPAQHLLQDLYTFCSATKDIQNQQSLICTTQHIKPSFNPIPYDIQEKIWQSYLHLRIIAMCAQ